MKAFIMGIVLSSVFAYTLQAGWLTWHEWILVGIGFVIGAICGFFLATARW